MTVTLQQREGPDARAGWFFIAVVACVLFTTVMLVRSCHPAAPSESVSYTQTNRILPRTRNTGRPQKRHQASRSQFSRGRASIRANSRSLSVTRA